MLAPASQARQHLTIVSLERNEVAIYYSGDAYASTPKGYYQHGPGPVVAFGYNRFSLRWKAFVIARNSGRVIRSESVLKGYGYIRQNPNIGDPSGLSQGKNCSEPVDVFNDEYFKGAFLFASGQSLGVQLTLPADPQWIQTPAAATSTNCYIQRTADSPETLVGAGSAGPQSGPRERALERALRPKFAIHIAGPSQKKIFDYHYSQPLPNNTGPYATVTIDIESSVDVIVGCELFDKTNGRCVKRYG
jgi:hypothetical protein